MQRLARLSACVMMGCAGGSQHDIDREAVGGPSPWSEAAMGPEEEYRGLVVFSSAFEQSVLMPTEGGEEWWVRNVPEELLDRYGQFERTAHDPAPHMYVRVRGHLSEPGAYGHLSSYKRFIDITEVLEMREIN